MSHKGFGYIIFLIFLTIILGLVFSYSSIFIRQHKMLFNSYQQFKALKYSESGINYSSAFTAIPAVNITGELTLSQLLNFPALTYTFQEGSFKLLRINGTLYSIGLCGEAVVVFQKKGVSWQHFID
jgi:hypothetical protein